MLKSPFPGMDPYLESRWPEVHASLIVYARNQINQQLPNDLQANIEENLAVHEADNASSISPDIHISQDSSFTPSNERSSIAVAAEPLLLKRAPHPTRHIALVDQCYHDGRYHRLDYTVDPRGKFDEQLTHWINDRLRSEGRRPE